jgi:4-hydroxy-tetrahydrodipicolinate synthase
VRRSPAELRDGMRGVWTALVTPFRGDRVHRASLRSLVSAQVEAGVSGLCPTGTTGEGPTITEAEHSAIVETVVEAAAGRVPVVPGAGSNDTRRAVALVRSARRAGADAVLAAAPPYNRPSQEGLYRHFRAMADDGGLPLLLYHIPGRTGVSIDVDTIARLERSGGVVGLKEAGGTVDRLPRLRDACTVPVLSGDDALTVAMIACGARGVVSVASNVAPAEVVALVEHALTGRRDAAIASDARLVHLVRALFLESNPSPVKAALRLLRRIPSAEVRLPLVAAGPETVAALKKALARLRRGD